MTIECCLFSLTLYSILTCIIPKSCRVCVEHLEMTLSMTLLLTVVCRKSRPELSHSSPSGRLIHRLHSQHHGGYCWHCIASIRTHQSHRVTGMLWIFPGLLAFFGQTKLTSPASSSTREAPAIKVQHKAP